MAPAGLLLALSLAPFQEAQATVVGELRLEIQLPTDNQGSFQVQTDDTLLKRHFNAARCECAEAGATFTGGIDYSTIRIQVLGDYDLAPDSMRIDAAVAVGDDCSSQDVDSLQQSCQELTPLIGDIVQFKGMTYDIALEQFMFKDGMCKSNIDSTAAWLVFNDTGGLPYEQYIQTKLVTIDTEPPPAPTDVKAASGENAVVVKWTNPAGQISDIKSYQVLCARLDDSGDEVAVFGEPKVTPEYETTSRLCGLSGGGGGSTDGGVPEPAPTGLASLDPSFLCGGTVGTAESVRIDGLENGVEYRFTLLSIDEVGNYTVAGMGMATPAPTIDFWEEYHRSGGNAEGGICLINSAFGDDHWMTRGLRDFRDGTLASSSPGRAFIGFYYEHVAGLGVYADRSGVVRVLFIVVLVPVALLAILWQLVGTGSALALLLAGIGWIVYRRRRRARRDAASAPAPSRWWRLAWGGTAALALLWLAAGPAAAQGAYDPYFDDFEPVTDQARAANISHWNFGIKAGPYLPDVDSDIMLAADEKGPWERTFGGSGLRIDLELDRYFFWQFGQIGLTTSLGFMRKSAHAFITEGCAADDPECIGGAKPVVDGEGNPMRSDENTTFRLIPAMLGVVYRFTALDDYLRVPVIPYGKAGLTYYLWSITQPSGSLAEVPTTECPDPSASMAMCDGDRALGASLGVQLTIGLAVRAERIDPQAALSLRNDMGIEHAGFYAELTYAKVDSFGNDKKLPVGDLTWFAGLNFEF